MTITLAEAIQDVSIVFYQVEFSLKNQLYWEQNHLSADDFVNDLTVRLPEGDLHFPTEHFADKANIIRAATVHISIAYGCTALALDQVLETAGFKPKPESDNNFDQIRCLVYLIRCAYAHRLADPYWEAYGKKIRQYQIDLGESNFTVDIGSLNGKIFRFEHIGGYANWHRIKDIVLAKLTAQQTA